MASQRLVFLLGSGISRHAGYPNMAEITERVLSGSKIYRHTDSTFRLGSDPMAELGLAGGEVGEAVSLLRFFAVLADRHAQGSRRQPNYEDLYYLARQLADYETRELDNPAIAPFQEVARAALPHLFEGGRLVSAASLARDYVADVTRGLLDRKPASPPALRALTDALADPRMERCDFFTLNHDCLLEQVVGPTVDGFGPEQTGVRYWHPSVFDESATRSRLFKLHGSVNWWRFRQNGAPPWNEDSIGIPTGDPEHTVSPTGVPQTPLGFRPLLLIGTFNKVFDYSHCVWSELHCRFASSLASSDGLIVAGYGFGDKGINSRITEWMYSKPGRRIVVVDPSPDPAQHARPAIGDKWKPWKDDGYLQHIHKTIEQTTWNEIADALR
jgi:SIR2-like domain